MPDGKEVRGEDIDRVLDRILLTQAFARAPNMQRLLSYLVDAARRGPEAEIKAIDIGRDALGRGPRFDPNIDPIVRVECARLRRLLAAYAEADGVGDPVRIELPRGGYRVRFVSGAAPLAGADPVPKDGAAHPPELAKPGASGAAAPYGGRLRRLALVGLGFAAAAVAGALFMERVVLHRGDAGLAALVVHPALGGAGLEALSMPLVHVEPFRHDPADTEAAAVAEQAAIRLRDALARFDDIHVLAGAAPREAADPLATAQLAQPQPRGPRVPVRGADYVVSAHVLRTAGGQLTLAGRLSDRNGIILLASVFQAPPAVERAGDWIGDVVRDAAARMASPYGIIASHEARRMTTADPIQNRRACILLTYEVWRQFDAARERMVVRCLSQAVAADLSDGLTLALLAYSEVIAYREGRSFDGEGASLQRAQQRANDAVSRAPYSSMSASALFGALKLGGNAEAAIVAGERALRLNPFNTDIMADVGAFMISAGDPVRGEALLKAALKLNASPPSWVWGANALAALMRGDIDGCIAHAQKASGNGYTLNIVMRYVAAHLRADADAAEGARRDLVAASPFMLEAPGPTLRHMGFSEPVVARLAPLLAQR